MRTPVLCLPILVTMAFSLSLVHANISVKEGIHGVAPSRLKLYKPDNKDHWRCLDGSKTIPFKAINDDYCDCPDGSDEPGTSACGNAYFYCANIGHVSSYIQTSRLNDGVCDQECCDGSDEYNRIVECPNICEQVGAEARKERERLRKALKKGSKVRDNYVAFGKNAKGRLQDQLDALQKKADQIKQTAATAQDALNAVKAKQQEYLESTKAEREEARELQLAPLIQQQIDRVTRAKEAKALLRSALEDLKKNQNKNFHDLVVKSTIAGFDEYLEDLKQEAADAAEREAKGDMKIELNAVEQLHAAQDQAYDDRKEIGRMFQLIKGMKEGYNKEYNDAAVLRTIAVLDEFAPSWQEHQNEFVGEDTIELPEEEETVMDIPAKVNKGALSGVYDRAQNLAKSAGLGFLFKATKSVTESTQEAYDKISDEERKIQSEIQDVERKLRTNYGPDEAFAQLADQCFDYKDVEYTYTLCLFGDAKQRSHSDTHLGTFSSWIGDNYDAQLYSGGTRCWNGPERSVKVVMSCGEVNEIVAVSEPEKCEYLFKFRTPAVCRLTPELEAAENSDEVMSEAPLPGSETGDQTKNKHDEL
ncbi:hypothetical protein EDD11_009554 [Mortierella claussenii]|nr:hypothetical protein EDD11_009554 [Mortierella claussenii]